MKIIIRLIGFPFMICLGLIGLMYGFLRWMGFYLLYGGEIVIYKDRLTPKRIKDIYELLEKDHLKNDKP